MIHARRPRRPEGFRGFAVVEYVRKYQKLSESVQIASYF